MVLRYEGGKGSKIPKNRVTLYVNDPKFQFIMDDKPPNYIQRNLKDIK